MTLYDLPPQVTDPCHDLHSRVLRWMHDPVYQPLAASIMAKRLHSPFYSEGWVAGAPEALTNLFSREQPWWTQGNLS